MPKTVHCLVADSSADDRQAIAQAVTATGLADFQITEVDDGMAAVVKAQTGRVDILLSEIDLPQMTGVEVARELRTEGSPGTAVVFVTGIKDMEAVRLAATEALPEALLVKPVNPDRLVKALKPLVDRTSEVTVDAAVPNGEVVPQAAIDAMRSAAGVDLKVEGASGDLPDGEVIFGIITLHGDVQWTTVLGLDRSAADHVAASFAGFEIDFDSEDMGDAVGELSNIFAGQIKVLLSKRKLAVDISLPTVMSAKEIRTRVQRSSNTHHTFLQSPVGRVWTCLGVGATATIAV